ncbi:MAG: TetR family transcriptional regulator [Prevotellaceae bacterium]|jgi:AcrR family transcriptional regulator|nr:TetR family transcriptional regulator [Prevotellaceae bacterium]
MAKTNKNRNLGGEGEDISTEEKIKAAALKLFQQKGFAGAKTRDIAEEAGINIALLNYYFRSKENLFEIIMEESIRKVFTGLRDILGDEETSLDRKLEQIACNYIDALLENPDLPLFILSEIQANVTGFVEKNRLPQGFVRRILSDSSFMKQLAEELNLDDPIQIVLNLLSLSVFPFAAKPLWLLMTETDADEFAKLMEQRKKLIPIWIKNMKMQ